MKLNYSRIAFGDNHFTQSRRDDACVQGGQVAFQAFHGNYKKDIWQWDSYTNL